jgi:ParB family chromosome partitioning protein
MKSSDKDVTRGKDLERKERDRVNLDEIVSDPNQPRKFYDKKALEALAETIKVKGVLQPILVRKGEDGKIYLVAGERRVRAARMARAKKIPAIFFKPNFRPNSIEISLIENLHRESLKPLEEAEAVQRLKEEHSYTDRELGIITGKSRVTITELLSINRLPEEVKELCRISDISKSTLIRIARMEGTDDDKCDEALRIVNRHPRPKTEIAKDRAVSLLKVREPFKDQGFEGYREEYRLEKDHIDELENELGQLRNLIENILNSQSIERR